MTWSFWRIRNEIKIEKEVRSCFKDDQKGKRKAQASSMIYHVYCIQNKLLPTYLPKLIVRSETPDQVAEISREGYIMQAKTDPSQCQSYLDLYEVGTFDTNSGKVELLAEKRLVCSNSVFENELKGAEHVLEAKPADAA